MKYAVEPDLWPTEFVDVLRRSLLAERRPVDDAARIAKMLSGADLIVTARDEDGTLALAISLFGPERLLVQTSKKAKQFKVEKTLP